MHDPNSTHTDPLSATTEARHADQVVPSEDTAAPLEPPDPDDEWEEIEEDEPSAEETGQAGDSVRPTTRVRRRRRKPRFDAAELRLVGRRALCKSIVDIAPFMLKTVKLRIL